MKYRRVVITRTGGPEVLQVIEDDLQQPRPDQCRIRVLASGVSYADIMMRKGMYPLPMPPTPYSPGSDVVGVIDALGEGCTRFEAGQTVAALTRMGGYTEYICLREAEVFPVPDGLDAAEAVCLPGNYVAAYQMLHRFAGIRAGECALIHGAAGGVGTALLQLGALAGLEMYGTASAPKQGLVSCLGATSIDYKSEDFVARIRELTGDGVDVVFDHVGGRHLWRSFRALRGGGRLIAYGEYSLVGDKRVNQIERVSQAMLLRVLGYWPGRDVRWYELDPGAGMIDPEWYSKDLATLSELLKQQKINPVIASRMALNEAARAHELIENAAVCGRIVLLCNQ